MANNEVKFRVNIDVDGQKKIVDVSTDISHLADEFEKARTKSTKLRDKLLEFTQTAQSFQNLTNGLRELTGILGEYTSAASAQEELETKLSVNMRNTMDARDEDISSIKSLISAQQQLGVVSDEVQLSGAQELATYLSEKETLERLSCYCRCKDTNFKANHNPKVPAASYAFARKNRFIRCVTMICPPSL